VDCSLLWCERQATYGVQTFDDRERASAHYLEKLFLANDDDITPLPRMFEETI